MDSSSCSSSDSESDNEGGPPATVEPNDTSDKGLTLVDDDNDSGLVIQLPPEGNILFVLSILENRSDLRKKSYIRCNQSCLR